MELQEAALSAATEGGADTTRTIPDIEGRDILLSTKAAEGAGDLALRQAIHDESQLRITPDLRRVDL